ncbi:MAG: SRPBCC family protein [Actinobacteria bacterium]|nr:SRPBCC family protein [Actinomycetota bacterium]
MITFANTLEIERPIDDVFAYLGDLRHVPAWNWAVTSTRKVSEGPIGVGTEFLQTRSTPAPATETLRLTAFEPPHTIAIEGALGPFAARLRYRLEQAGALTRVVNDVELTSPGMLRLAAPILARRIQGSVAENLRVLKALLEGPQAVRR